MTRRLLTTLPRGQRHVALLWLFAAAFALRLLVALL
jgi:hypothetical protein